MVTPLLLECNRNRIKRNEIFLHRFMRATEKNKSGFGELVGHFDGE